MGVLFAAPQITIAEGTVVRRVAFLEIGAPNASGLWASLRELGWVEGKNLQVERRSANSIEGLRPLAEELVSAKIDVIVVDGPNSTRAAMRATTTIPIVFWGVSDPVLSGLVASLARPGGNVTGFSVATPDVDAKLLSILKQLVPNLQRIGMLETSGNPQFDLFRGRFEDSCRSAGVEPVFVGISEPGEIDGAIAALARQRAQALVMVIDGFSEAHGFEIIETALKRGLPTVTQESDYVRQAGALLSYSVTQAEVDRRTAYYVDRILRGKKPADLPVEQPTQFEFVLNLRTAQALGLSIPQSVLLRADDVIR